LEQANRARTSNMSACSRCSFTSLKRVMNEQGLWPAQVEVSCLTPNFHFGSCTFRLRYTWCLPVSYSPMWPITRDIFFSCPLLPFSLHILVEYLTLDHPSRCPISLKSVLVVNFKLLSKVISVLSLDFSRRMCCGYDVVEDGEATKK